MAFYYGMEFNILLGGLGTLTSLGFFLYGVTSYQLELHFLASIASTLFLSVLVAGTSYCAVLRRRRAVHYDTENNPVLQRLREKCERLEERHEDMLRRVEAQKEYTLRVSADLGESQSTEHQLQKTVEELKITNSALEQKTTSQQTRIEDLERNRVTSYHKLVIEEVKMYDSAVSFLIQMLVQKGDHFSGFHHEFHTMPLKDRGHIILATKSIALRLQEWASPTAPLDLSDQCSAEAPPSLLA